MPALFCKITSRHDGDFYCLNCLHSFRTENKRKEHNHREKSMTIPSVIYADMESLLEK